MNELSLNQTEFNNLSTEEKLLGMASRLKVPANISATDALAALKARISEKENTPDRTVGRERKILYLIGSIAAGIAVFFGVWILLHGSGNEKLFVGNGDHKEFRLPDGSHVSVNSSTTLAWSGREFSDNRHVQLSGEAFFAVIKGTPFTISTEKGTIEVLGTSFNVFARANFFKVSCFTGKVQVSASERSVILMPGESAELSDNELLKYPEENLNRTNSWINGEFFYDNICLNNVLDEIERQFSVKFDAKDFAEKYFTGSFNNKDLRSVLDIVFIPMGLNYEIGSKGKISVTEYIK
jgi:transmembrane sensor